MPKLIFTNHVRDRIRERRMSGAQIEQTFYNPEKKFQGKEANTIVFERQFGMQRVQLITKRTAEGEWVAISAWIDPPYVGTADARKRELWRASQTAGFWGKWWITLRRILGI